MKPGIPWSIKGIESETREAAKAAARRSGMTLGQWLNGMIQVEAQPKELFNKVEKTKGKKDKSSNKNSKKHKKSAAKKASKIDDRLSELADQLMALSEQSQATAVNRFVEFDNEPVAERALDAMIERIESGEARSIESFEAVNIRLDAIDEKLAEPVEEDQDQSPEFQALETALRNIVEHIETSEKRNRDALGNMQERMSEMSKRAEQAQSSSVNQTAPAIAALDARVAELALQHEQATSASNDETRSFLEERLSTIGEQIDAVRHSSDAMTRRAETTATDAAKREAREVEQRVASLIGEARTLIVKSASGGETLHVIRGEIESLNQRFDDIKAESASDQDVQSLKLAIEQLTSSVTAGPDMQPIAAMEQRLGELTLRLDEKPAADHMAPQIAELEQRIVDLDQQLALAMEQQSDTQTFAALESQISMVADRMSATEEKLGALTTIEQSITKLYSAIEENKADAHNAAEGAVARMADDIMQQAVPATAQAGPSPELAALEEGLAAVKQSSRAAEQHNQETLEAVHETLEQIITKLAGMEARDAAAPAAQPQQVEPQVQPQLQPEVEAGNADWQAAVQSHLHENLVLESVQPDQNIPQDSNPNSGPSSPDFAFSNTVSGEQTADVSPAFNPGPLPDMAQPEMPVEIPAEPVVAAFDPATVAAQPATDEPPLDYIAQARLASQSASPQAKSPTSKGGGFFTDKIMAARSGGAEVPDSGVPAEPKKSKSLFSLPFLTKKKVEADNDQSINLAPQGDQKGASRKRLLMIGLVLLVAAGAVAYNKVGGKSATEPASTASAPAKVIPPKVSPVETPKPKKTSQTIEQTPAAPALVKQVSLTLPQTNPITQATTANQTGMPAAQALESSNRPTDPILAAPADPVTTASLPPAPTASHNIQSPFNIQTAARTTPPQDERKVEPTTPSNNAGLPPEAAGTLELRQAAVKGDSSAQFVIASRYASGKQLKRDYGKAASWYQKAASSGLAPAQYRLGTLFERGNGVPKDLNAARLWYERAAESGNVKAMHNLAVIYASASGGQTDFVKAQKWFEKASNHGLKDSQFNLAVIHERGLTGKRDQKQAFYWYSLAAASGDRDAGVKAHTLKNFLSAADIASAEKRQASWKPQRALKTGNFVAIKDPKWRVAGKSPTSPKGPVQLGAKPSLSGKVLVKQTQTLLTKMGFDIGSADGVMGSRTANAVRLFQLQNGLQVNGMVTNGLLQQLQARS